MTREQRIAQIIPMRRQGMKLREIAERLDLSVSYVGSIISDADGSKSAQRRVGYGGTCRVCGARTDGSNGKAKAPTLCSRHAGEHRRVWTRERIIDCFRDYVDQYGQPPSARDWNPTMAKNDGRDDIAQRFYADGCWPNVSTVQEVFGSWSSGIRAAGFQSRKVGRPRKAVTA